MDSSGTSQRWLKLPGNRVIFTSSNGSKFHARQVEVFQAQAGDCAGVLRVVGVLHRLKVRRDFRRL